LNFNLLFLLFIFIGCGVKGNPVSPADQTTPSVLDNYPDIQVDRPLKDSAIKRK